MLNNRHALALTILDTSIQVLINSNIYSASHMAPVQ